MNPSQTILHVLLDIEGTTCPISFVSEVLFPYAQQRMLPFLKEHQSEEAIHNLLQELRIALKQDPSPEAIALRATTAEQDDVGLETLGCYINALISTDRKVTPLKDLQGMIWEEGYQRKEIIAPLFADVPNALQRWHDRGLTLSVYSSGSVQAQKLLYSHTEHGDLSPLFSHWFDTRAGAKNLSSSYEQIATILQTTPERILFISDSASELKAADQAKLAVIYSQRASNPDQDAKGFPSLPDFSRLLL